MLSSLTCIAKPDLSASTLASAYSTICGSTSENCPALHGNGGNGTYGAYSMCSLSERLSWALNELYTFDSEGCSSDVNAEIQDTYYSSNDSACAEALEEAGEYGTGTITSFPTATDSPGSAATSYYPTDFYIGDEVGYLSQGAIAGITIGAIIVVAATVLVILWFCCWRRGARRSCNGCCASRRGLSRGRGMDVRAHDKGVEFGNEESSPVGHHDGGASIISDDSRGMVELQPWDERYLPSRNQGEGQSEGSQGAQQEQLTAPKMVSPVFAPSPMSSMKELPAFRTHDQPEDKSLGSMKFLSPVVKVVPVQPNTN
jgi:hypothetical protein